MFSLLPTAGIDYSETFHTNKFNESYPNYLGSFVTLQDANGNISQALDLCDGTRIEVYGSFRTHPSTAIGNLFQPSPADIQWAANHQGTVNYILGKDGLLKYDGNGNTFPNLSAQDLANCICK